MVQALNVAGLSIAEAARQIAARELSPVELTDAYLDQIERLNPRINAYVTVTAERAREDARRAADEIARGAYRGPLHGIPMGLKDLFLTKGIRTTGGAKFLADWVPEEDATVVRKLAEAGAVLLGKLNTHELAWGATTNNPHYGATHNPWKLGHVPGGSSGGSGAAIAAGLACGTLGTDTGGSIRIPAALCGVVGLKPTYGRVSKAGVLTMSWTLDHPGPITHTVEDAALMLQALAGYDPADFSSVRTPVDDYVAHLRDGVRGLRAGVARPYFFNELDAEVGAAVEQAIDVLRDLGVAVRDVELPLRQEDWQDWMILTALESQEFHAKPWQERPGDFSPELAAILGREYPSGYEVALALRRRYAFKERARQLLEEVDVLLTPTVPGPAPPIGEGAARLAANTWPFNVTGQPALSVPCGFTTEGLPVGLQLVGRDFDEATVLRAGYTYEQATDWHRRRPAELHDAPATA